LFSLFSLLYFTQPITKRKWVIKKENMKRFYIVEVVGTDIHEEFSSMTKAYAMVTEMMKVGHMCIVFASN